MNKVILIGRLVRDPETSERGKKGNEILVADYCIAVDKRGSDEANFINIVSFGKQAEFVDKYFHKGLRVAIEGRLDITKYTNAENENVYYTSVLADSVEFADSLRDTEPVEETKEEKPRARKGYKSNRF